MKLGKSLVKILFLACSFLLAGPAPQAAAGIFGALGRGAERSVMRSVGRSEAKAAERATVRAFSKDAARDASTAAKRLSRPKTVFRYVPAKTAKHEMGLGIPARTHMTAVGGPGRPMGAGKAMGRYGLNRRPGVRETVRLPKRFPVRFNRAVLGEPGVGELTSPKRIPGKAIVKAVRLH